MKLQRRHSKRGRVEIIPMIDTILILLIFYMSFSSLSAKEKRIDANLPLVSKKVSPTDVPMDLTIHVKKTDEIIVNGAVPHTAETLREAMSTYTPMAQQVSIVIEADPDTTYQAVISALDACAQAQLKKVAFRPLPAEKTGATPAAAPAEAPAAP